MLLTVEEMAERMRLRPATVYRFIRDGVLPAVHLGRVVRVPASGLEASIAAGGWKRPAGENRAA